MKHQSWFKMYEYTFWATDKTVIRCTMHGKGPYVNGGQRRPRSACANAQVDWDLPCPLTESMNTVKFVKIA